MGHKLVSSIWRRFGSLFVCLWQIGNFPLHKTLVAYVEAHLRQKLQKTVAGESVIINPAEKRSSSSTRWQRQH